LTAAQAAPRQGAHPLPLRTALVDEGNLQADAAQVRQTGITMVRLTISWSAIAPDGSAKPAFNAADPADPAYDWTSADAAVSGALADGLQPIIDIIGAPSWAEENVPRPYYGSIKPSPHELGLFAQAIATRYSGNFENQPRVRFWQLWNEPNLIYYLQPQYENGRVFSPSWEVL
jgi:aryl-phospho-beta-D-glucosidase BglC (GH1 family)